jgi:hypothetical protein
VGAIKSLLISNVAGSLCNGLPAEVIRDNEWASLVNFYQYKSTLQKRPGVQLLTSTPLGSKITGIFAMKTSLAVWNLLVGFGTGVALKSGSGFSTLAIADGLTYTDADYLWSWVQYNDYVVAARRGLGTLKHTDGASFITDGGLEAPATAMTMATGDAGAILSGDYYAVCIYRDSDTGNVSGISPVSALYTAPGSFKINYSGIPVSSSGLVDEVEIYRTLRGQTGAYYYVATVPNGQTTYTGDNLLTASMGDAVSLDEGLPPDNVECVVGPWKERLVCHDGSTVYVSNYQQMESFSPTINQFPIGPDDGHRITGLRPWGERTFIGKTNGIFLLTSPDGFSFKLEQLPTAHGCYSHHSIQEVDGNLIWYGGDDFYMMQPGGLPGAIGDDKIRETLDSIADEDKEFISAAIDPDRSWYIASIPVLGIALVYNYSTGVWTTFSYNRRYVPGEEAEEIATQNALGFIASFYGEDIQRLLYGTFRGGFASSPTRDEPGYLFNLLSSVGHDEGNRIECVGRSKAFGMGDDGYLHAIRKLVIDCSEVAAEEDFTVSLYRDKSETAYKTRMLALPGGWAPIRLSNHWAPAYLTQVEITYSGLADFILSQLAFDIVASSRRRRFSL